MRKAFSDALVRLAQQDPRVLLITGDHGYELFDGIRQHCPGQFINAGIAEQNMVGMAAGLARTGFRPFVYGLAAFVPVRVLEQIKLGRGPRPPAGCLSGRWRWLRLQHLGHQPPVHRRHRLHPRRAAVDGAVAGGPLRDDGLHGSGLRARRPGLHAHGQVRPG
jgi:hypothetical protein